jgi:aminopeptidase YwaD
MPKAFVFYNPPEHKEIYRLIEEKAPKAIVTATARNPSLAGGNYPCPMIEDGDFDIPSVYLTEEEGARLAENVGLETTIRIRAGRQPSSGENVVARKGSGKNRIVVCAHIDAKKGTPGATDNATGVATLLLLAELLSGYNGEHTIEIVALNGEDYYSVPGQMVYLAENEGAMGSIRLAINIDGAGYKHGKTAWSLYSAPDDLSKTIRDSLHAATGVVEGPQWYQGDHSMFVQAGRPALAFTSLYQQEHPDKIFSHTPADHPREVDEKKLAELSDAVFRVIQEL